jgi:DNA-binding MarR family transcriptional regulator
MSRKRREAREFFEQMSAIVRRVRTAAAQTYGRLEIGSAQARFLRHIDEERGISQAELARATDSAPTVAGRALEPLVNRGWVKRTRSSQDKREYLLELTPSGRNARKWVEEARDEIVGRMARVLDERDLADFERIGKKLLAAFD